MKCRIISTALLIFAATSFCLGQDAKADSEDLQYKLLATTRTSTMQKEIDATAAQGYRLIPSTMISKNGVFAGAEIVLIMERPPKTRKRYEYKLLATSRTSTLQKEVTEAKASGYAIVGMVSRGEHIVVMERESVKKN